MHTKKSSCTANVNGEMHFSASHYQVSPRGSLQILFDRTVALEGSRKQVFSRPSFSLHPFTSSLLTGLSPDEMARGSTLEMAGTNIGWWRVTHDPKERRSDSYRLKSAVIRTKFFMDGICLEIDAQTEVGLSEYSSEAIANDLPPVTLSISMFVPTQELEHFLLPDESHVYSMRERLLTLPTSPA